ncbi:MAG TPA: hypothetical protein VKZ59_11885 [Acidobacteriota bacterium]|nr:hypothetical protein [Acidobacteriota bacterium]
MFDQNRDRQSSSTPLLWKILPVAVLLFGVMVAVVFYISEGGTPTTELTGILTEGDVEFERYRQNVEIINQSIQMGQNVAGNWIIMVSGIIENRGERELDVVQVKLTLFNHEEPIHEIIRTPIQPSPYTSSVPALGRKSFDFYVEEIPEDWLAVTAELTIHGFRFPEE